ncbi:MAG: sugar phosphate isomerase/epimerase family protein [Candidatus Bipolaricaulia bacterium]
MNVKVGSAPNSWGVEFVNDPRQTPWHRFLDEVAEAGYEWIEVGPWGYLPNDLPTLRAELNKRGLKICGTFVMRDFEDESQWPSIEAEILEKGELLSALGAEFLIFIDDTYTERVKGTAAPRLPAVLDDDAWKRLIEAVHQFADLTHDRFGLRLVFHPHTETHVEYEDQIETLLEQTDPDRVSLCLDTGHHAYRGGDPISFMHRYHHRIPYLHLKSIDPEVKQKVEAEKIPFIKAVKMDMFCEPSKGVVDFLAFRDALREIDYDGWAIVEHDMYPVPPPFDKPLPIAKRTRAYFRKIGIG